MKNVFLTGERKIGKSTIIKKALEAFKGSLGGFKTAPCFLGDGSKRYTIEGLNPIFRGEARWICVDNGEGRMIGLTGTFEDYGVRILKHSLKEKPDLIIMDELGLFESEAYNFQKHVFAVLESPLPVLGVLKAASSSFLNEIRNRRDVIILPVTGENRDLLAEKVAGWLQAL